VRHIRTLTGRVRLVAPIVFLAAMALAEAAGRRWGP
jgi:hypothetical protein